MGEEIFNTVHRTDHLGFRSDGAYQYQSIAEFLDFEPNDISKLARVSQASVRYDRKMPHGVKERLEEIANVCNLVAEFFGGDAGKTALWFRTPNPALGNISPRDMLRLGRYKRLMWFVLDALNEKRPHDEEKKEAA